MREHPDGSAVKFVVITGSSTGIGRACALLLDRKGFRVFAGVRKTVDGDALRAAGSDRLTPVLLDVTDPAAIESAAQRIASEIGDAGLSGLVNNAGTTFPCPVEYLGLDEFRHQLEVNLVGPLAVTQALLPLLRQGKGTVVNVTSGAGKVGVPFMAPYVSAKHGLEGLSDVMRHEFRQQAIRVVVIEPGFVSTAMCGKLTLDTETTVRSLPAEGRHRYASALRALAGGIYRHATAGAQPEIVAEDVLRSLTATRPRARYPSGKGAKRMLYARRMMPDRWFDQVILRIAGVDDKRVTI